METSTKNNKPQEKLHISKEESTAPIQSERTIIESVRIEDSDSPEIDHKNLGFYVKDSMYWTKEQRGKTTYEVKLSNFVMKSLYHLINGSNNSQRLILLQRKTGAKVLVEVYSSEMKPETFETILKSKQCTFLGNSSNLKIIFEYLMDNEDEAITLPILGWNNDHKIYIFADSVFTASNELITANELGIVGDKNKKYYLPAASKANTDNQELETDRLYSFHGGELDFRAWANLFYEAYGPNSIIGIAYLILSIFRDLVFSQVGFFPFLFLFGIKGSGKTSFTDKLLRLFGNDVKGTPLNNASIPGMSRQLSGRNNSLFYFKEYTNQTDDLIEAFILNAYDGAGRMTAIKSNDHKTKSYPVRSAVIFDGNFLPSKNTANLSRMILLNFEKTSYSSDEQIKYKQFEEYSKLGFGNVLTEILKLRHVIERVFPQTLKGISKNLSGSELKLEERSIKHTALLITILDILKDYLPFPFTIDDAKKVILDNAEYHAGLMHDTGPVSIFWEAFSHNVSKSYLIRFDGHNKNSSHYNVKYETDAADKIILQIRFQQVWPAYVKYCKENNLRILDGNSLKSMLTSSGNLDFIPTNQKGRFKAYTDKNFGSCYQFWGKLTENGFSVNGIDVFM